MLRKIVVAFGGISLAGGFYLKYQKVDLKSEYLRRVVDVLHNQNPKYSTFILRSMIRFNMIKYNSQMKGYVFSQGFDLDGYLLQGLSSIGFDTVQIGPLSLLPSCSEQSRLHFGSKIPLSNVYTFSQNRDSTKTTSKIGVCITPNYEILKYTPYLIQQNVLHCLKQFEELNLYNKNLSIDRYVLKLNQKQMKQMDSTQYLSMIKQLIINSHKIIDQTLESRLKQQPKPIQLIKPQIYVQIPNQDQNPKLNSLIKEIPELRNIIVDSSEFQISRNKENHKNVQIILGKRRITFNQIVQKIIDDTL